MDLEKFFDTVNQCKLMDMKMLLLQVDEWYCRRLQMVIWKQWKGIKTGQDKYLGGINFRHKYLRV